MLPAVVRAGPADCEEPDADFAGTEVLVPVFVGEAALVPGFAGVAARVTGLDGVADLPAIGVDGLLDCVLLDLPVVGVGRGPVPVGGVVRPVVGLVVPVLGGGEVWAELMLGGCAGPGSASGAEACVEMSVVGLVVVSGTSGVVACASPSEGEDALVPRAA